jgi:exopolysaccharide biosynthesis polyprenyl glycosylphosphotransferase
VGQVERRKRITRIEAVWHLTDGIGVVGGFAIGYAIRFAPPVATWFPPRQALPSLGLYLAAGFVAAILWIILFHALDLYRVEGTRRGLRTPVLLRATGLGMLGNAGIAFFYRGVSFSRLAAPVIWLIAFLLIRTLRRAGLRILVGVGGVPPVRFALVGGGPAGLRLAQQLPRAGVVPHDFRGLFRLPGDPPPPAGVVDLGGPERLAEVAAREGLDRVVVALPAENEQLVERVAQTCRELDIDFDLVPDLGFPFRGGIQVEEIAGLPVVRGRPLPLVGWNGVMKRTVDIIVSGALLILLAPALLLLALAVKVDSRGPVFYGQERMGRDRRVFRMVKFRSMRVDAETASGPVWAKDADPRRTKVGSFLRTWSLDELPQLWNVLKGDMSLVGPRPERPYFVDQFLEKVPDYYGRHRVKSGVTGWAQVNGLRGNVPVEDRTKYDLYYMENWSLWLDVRILLMTVKAVITHRGS